MPPAIEAIGLRKAYGSFEALKGVDLAIEHGEVFALLGPNGAGKTTMVEILEGYRERSGGEARVLGVDPAHPTPAWRARVGIVLQSTNVFDELNPTELISHFAGFYGRPLEVATVIKMVGLEEQRAVRCSKLSGGQKRRVDLALGIIGDPELIFLDEPTTGLDPQGRRQIWDVIRGFTALGKTVLLTTHYLDEAEALAGRVGVIQAGTLLEVAPPAELGGRDRARAEVGFVPEGPLAGRDLPPLPGEVTHNGTGVTVSTDVPTAVVASLAAWALAAGVTELPGLAVRRPTLEDIYLSMIGKEHGS